jgi:NTP pyrophosphatase (non-canonical NTP hydrolase)
MDNYINLALRTDPSPEQYEVIAKRNEQPNIMRLEHGIMGIVTEAGELMDQLKKHIVYGKDLDLVNLAEETGDVFWYLALCVAALAELMGREPEELERSIKEINIAKLKARYPEKFSEVDAVVRNLTAERDILDKVEGTNKIGQDGEDVE